MTDNRNRPWQRLHTLVFLAMTAPLSGCGTYLGSRIDDFQDMARVGVEIGPQFGIHLEATPLMHTGLGFGLVPNTLNTGYGFMGRRTPVKYHVQCFDLLYVHYRAMDGYPEDCCNFTHLISSVTPTRIPRHYDPVDWLDMEVAVIAVLGVRAGINPGQVADFLSGLYTWDIAGDDLVEPEEKKKKPGREAEGSS